jgi:hypothetical protein
MWFALGLMLGGIYEKRRCKKFARFWREHNTEKGFMKD